MLPQDHVPAASTQQLSPAPAAAPSPQVERMRRAEAERLGLNPDTATWDEIRQAQALYMQQLRAGFTMPPATDE